MKVEVIFNRPSAQKCVRLVVDKLNTELNTVHVVEGENKMTNG